LHKLYKFNNIVTVLSISKDYQSGFIEAKIEVCKYLYYLNKSKNKWENYALSVTTRYNVLWNFLEDCLILIDNKYIMV